MVSQGGEPAEGGAAGDEDDEDDDEEDEEVEGAVVEEYEDDNEDDDEDGDEVSRPCDVPCSMHGTGEQASRDCCFDRKQAWAPCRCCDKSRLLNTPPSFSMCGRALSYGW